MKRTLPGLTALTALLVLLASYALQAQGSVEFPPDPKGITVIDRAYEHIYAGQDGTNQFILYAVMYNRGAQGTVDVYKGVEGGRGVTWKKLYTWKVMMEKDVVTLPKRCILKTSTGDEGKAHFSIIMTPHRYEAMVTMYLIYDFKSGKFEEGWVD